MTTNDDPSIITGKALERYFDFNEALAEFHKLFNIEKKDERTIAILGGTFLEMSLEHLLYAFLPDDEKEVKKLFEYNQPLGNFSNKIAISYCLGLIDKMVKNDLNLIRKIRNKFAHNLYSTFEDEEIKSWSNGLKFHIVSMMMKPPVGATSLEIFQVGVNQLISNLHGYISISRSKKRKIKGDFKKFL